jgi:hypothetical protein
MLNTDVLYQHVLKMTVFWDVATCSLVETGGCFRCAFIALVMEAVSTSETSVSF